MPLRLPAVIAVLAACVTSALGNLEEAQFRGRAGIHRYDIRITYKPMPPFPHYPDAPTAWTVIDSLEVFIDGKPVKIPKSATSDLFWPHSPQTPFPGPDDTVRFRIGGADGEYSYDATFVFSGTRLIQREKKSRSSGKTKILTFPPPQRPRPR